MNGIKRVRNLYRVSSKMQLNEENDIPMQRNACLNFIQTKPFWQFDMEYLERGVSGYHKKLEQRDVLLQIKQDALDKKFDVLLVFMFDRIGRREDETPFVVEWLVEQGIEVWSVKEGQQKFDDRTDKLLNYIRFWQSGGESEKTGIRVKEALRQNAEAGKFGGGRAPYGYKLVLTDEINKKGRRIHTMVQDEETSKIVKQIFGYAREGLGKYKITEYLNEQNIPAKTVPKWNPASVDEILRNPVYTGYYVYGKRKPNGGNSQCRTDPSEWIYSKEQIPELIIIDEETWRICCEHRQARKIKLKGENEPKKELVLVGVLRCGYCNGKMNSITRRYTRICKTTGKPNASSYHYYCGKKSGGKECGGLNSYGSQKTEKVAFEEIYNYLDSMKSINLKNTIDTKRKEINTQFGKDIALIQKELNRAEFESGKLNEEVIKCLQGKSKFSSEQLARISAEKDNEIAELKEQIKEKETLLLTQLDRYSKLERINEILPNWREQFEHAPFEEQRNLIATIIDVIYIYRDKIEIHFKLNISDVNTSW